MKQKPTMKSTPPITHGIMLSFARRTERDERHDDRRPSDRQTLERGAVLARGLLALLLGDVKIAQPDDGAERIEHQHRHGNTRNAHRVADGARSTPNDTRSHSESIWMPNTSASFVRFVARAIFPSNISQRPQSAKADHRRPDLPVRRGADAPHRNAQLYVCQNDRYIPESNEFLAHCPFSVSKKIYLIIKHAGNIFQERDLTRRTLSAIL